MRSISKESYKSDLWNYKENPVLEGIYLWTEFVQYGDGFNVSYVKEGKTGKMLSLYTDKHKLKPIQSLPENTLVRIEYKGSIKFEGQPDTFSPMDNFEIQAEVPDSFNIANK